MLVIKHPKSLKSKLILYFLLVTVVPSITISLFYYDNAGKTLKNNMIENSANNLSYIMDNVDKQLKVAEILSDWIFINRTMERILTRDYSTLGTKYDNDIKIYQEVVDDQLISSPVGKHVSSLLIIGNNGVDLRAGYDAAMVDEEDIKQFSWYKLGMEQQGKIYWNSIIKNPASVRSDEFVIPVVRPIVRSTSNDPIGWSMIAYKHSLVSDIFKKYRLGDEGALYIIDSQGLCISHQQERYIGKDLTGEEHIKTVLNGSPSAFSIRVHGKEKLVVSHKSPNTGWIIVQELSYSELYRQNRILWNVTFMVLILSILVSSLFTVFLSINLTNPLKKLLKKIQEVAKGNFERDTSLEGPDEMGTLGSGINQMSQNIRELLEKVVDEEREKRQLELKVLQNQINPHFLYNTLNSIKWMATMQKADGIRDMVSSLGRLLKDTIKGTSERVTLKEELSILEDYVHIQKIRYSGKVEVFYAVEVEAYSCRLLKFTLQPIVENAIFHGIEPKADTGRIDIKASVEEESLVLVVEDDGVGMSEEQIRNIFNNREEGGNVRGLSGIGVKNVDERIKLTYGEKYGLSIESVQGKFTKVRIKIPLER